MKYTILLPVFCTAVLHAADTIAPAVITYPLEQVLAIAESNATQIKIIEAKSNAGRAEVDMYRSNARPNIQFGSGVSYVSQSYATQKMQQAMLLPLFAGSSGDMSLMHLMNLGLIDTSDNAFERAYVLKVDSIANAQSSGFNYPDRINGYAFNWSLSAQQPLITFGKVRHAIKMARYPQGDAASGEGSLLPAGDTAFFGRVPCAVGCRSRCRVGAACRAAQDPA